MPGKKISFQWTAAQKGNNRGLTLLRVSIEIMPSIVGGGHLAEETTTWLSQWVISWRDHGRTFDYQQWQMLCSGCSSVGRAVATNTRGLLFESSYRLSFINLFTLNCMEKTKIKKKRPGMANLKKTTSRCWILWITSVTRKKSPNVYKSCLKTISLEKW